MENEVSAMFGAWGPIIAMLIIFYFLLYRPQKQAAKQREEMLNSLKAGLRVITIGGIYGTITSPTDTVIHLKIAENVEIEVARGSINGIITGEQK